MRKPYLIGLLMACALVLTACGGGGGGSSSSSSGSSSSGGSSGGGSTTTVVNSVPMVVNSGPPAAEGTLNEPFVSVTICNPSNPSNCQTIDDILVDTGSYGLRIMSSVLSPTLGLTKQTDSSGNVLAECATFGDGYSWGTLQTANLQMGTETANNLTVQIIGDPSYSNIPASCSATGPVSEDTVYSFGANGVIGVGPFAQDCGQGCVQTAYPVYYSCSASSCQEITMSLSAQLQNPVSLFATDNNGVVLTLPSVPNDVASSVTGTLTFGIGTQSNNGLGSSTQVYTTDPNTGNITTTYKGASYPDSFLDSGSNGLFFNDSSIPQCNDGSGFYCPSSVLNLSAVNTGQNNVTGAVNFSVGSEVTIPNNDAVFSQLAGTNGDPASFDWGLPFFYGRTVYTAIQGFNTPGGAGPYFAY